MHTTKEFDGEFLTWRQLKEYVNSITDEEVLDTAVIAQEHHHFTYTTFNPVIQVRMDDEKKNIEEDPHMTSDDYEQLKNLLVHPIIRDKTDKLIHDIETNNAEMTDWDINHVKQPNLSLPY